MPSEAAPETVRARPASEQPPTVQINEDPFGDLLEELDEGFAMILSDPPAGPAADAGHNTDSDLREVRVLFEQIAATHMRPVRDFAIELELGEPSREWLDLVHPAVSSLRKSADGMGLGDLALALDGYISALDRVAAMNLPHITGAAKQMLVEGYAELVRIMPEAFTLSGERDRREPIIVNSLLRQVKDVRKVALDKLYKAGLTSLDMYFMAKPYDVSHAAGLSMELATRIVERFRLYKQELQEERPAHDRTREFDKVTELTAQLRVQNDQFDAASRSWTRQAAEDKKRLRQERSDTVLELNLMLARLGEVALVNELEKMPFQRKVDTLERWLEETRAARALEAQALQSQGMGRR
jgi:hypothetical protein